MLENRCSETAFLYVLLERALVHMQELVSAWLVAATAFLLLRELLPI